MSFNKDGYLTSLLRVNLVSWRKSAGVNGSSMSQRFSSLNLREKSIYPKQSQSLFILSKL